MRRLTHQTDYNTERREWTEMSKINEGHLDGEPLCSVCKTRHYAYSFSCEECPSGSVQKSISILCCCVLGVFLLGVYWYLFGFAWIARSLRCRPLLRFYRMFDNSKIQKEQLERTKGNSKQAEEARRKGTDKLVDGGKVKILLSFCQVSAVYNVVYDVEWPSSFIQLLSYFRVVMEINLMNLPVVKLPGLDVNLAMECEPSNFEGISRDKDGVKFYDTFLFQVCVPISCTVFFFALGVLGWIYFRFLRWSSRAVDAVKRAEDHVTRCWELFFFMLLVVRSQFMLPLYYIYVSLM